MNAEEELTIQNLVIQADQLATDRNPQMYVELFSDNSTMTMPNQVVTKNDLLTTVENVWTKEPKGSVHLTIAPVVQSVEHNKASATSTLLILNPTNNQIITIGHISHQLIKQDNTWLFSNRTIQ